MNRSRVFVSGCYDLLHSGHVEFFRQAAELGELYVGIGSDQTILNYKHHATLYPEQERLFMVRSIRYVHEAYINAGSGILDFEPTLDIVHPDILVVNADGDSAEKRELCRRRGIRYVVLERTPHEGLVARSSTALKVATGTSSAAQPEADTSLPVSNCLLPTRLDLAGTWIDQPYVSCHAPGWALTISLLPTFTIRERCGLSTSTRNTIRRIWPIRLPDIEPETLARLVFCFENHPEREDGIISGAQDAIGICVPGLCRHYYDGHFWPSRIETCNDETILAWLESHLVMVPLEPRPVGCSVVEGRDINPTKVRALTAAADACWQAILARDLDAFVCAYRASFEAQVAMFPGMIRPSIVTTTSEMASPSAVTDISVNIAHWSAQSDVLAWKMPGAGGGGYLALVVNDTARFCEAHSEAFPIHIRRS